MLDFPKPHVCKNGKRNKKMKKKKRAWGLPI